MNPWSSEFFAAYWSSRELLVNGLVFINIAGAFLLGLVVGYERSYHGRAAGMRTYGLVCMASAALTVAMGYPDQWFGGHVAVAAGVDPSRVIQGIVTGVGFLGAGVIMKDGLNISGLTTAASIWSASAIGVMVGLGFYAAAILLTVLSASLMMWMSRLERWLPAKEAVAVVLRFRPNFAPREDRLREIARDRGYEVATGSLSMSFREGAAEWRFIAVSIGKLKGARIGDLARELTAYDGVESYELAHARN